jgi:hypothetical protein
MMQNNVPDDQLWEVILGAGIFTEAEVLAVIRARVCSAVEAAKAAVKRLELADADCVMALGAPIPAASRRSYGPTVSQRDMDGARRVLAAITQKSQDEITNPPVGAVVGTALRGIARRLAEGDPDSIASLIEYAHRQQAARGAGTCRECGCIDLVACKDGCTWVDDSHTLCSACISSPRAQ